MTAVAPGGWALKGGFSLDLRLHERARATQDIDLDWQASPDELLDTLLDAAAHNVGDFFAFGIERTGPAPERLGGSHRFRASASLAGRHFETFPLDVAPNAGLVALPDMLTTPNLLTFAGVPPVPVPALALEQQTAEKLHACTRSYQDARPSSRVKDLVDIVLIAELAALDAAVLHTALRSIFARRSTHPLPSRVPPPPSAWTIPFRELADVVGIPGDLESAHAAAADLLTPLLDGRVHDAAWDPARRCWI